MISKIISGGQTGVDLAALDAAKDLGIPTGGWMPKGFITEDGKRPLYANIYGMLEMPTGDYMSRTRKNVVDSDGTLIIVFNKPLTGGTKRTAEIAGCMWKPWLSVDLSRRDASGWPVTVSEWIAANKIGVLNIAGPRESKCPGIYEAARKFLLTVLSGEITG